MKKWEEEVNNGRVPEGMTIHMVMTAGFILMWPGLAIYIWIKG